MSFHMHLRAAPPAEIRPDGAWLEAFLLTAWSNHQEEYAAGIAESIEKDFTGMNQLYTGALDGPEDAGDPSRLPIYGGEIVFHEDGLPFVILQPDQVEETAAFLHAVDFDALWEARGAAISSNWGDPTQARDVYLSHHEGLLAFYRAAAHTGRAVLKAFWY
jgi:hypothetical protein